MTRLLLLGLMLAFAAPTAAEDAAVKPHATVRVRLVTSAGTIVLALEKQAAPVTTANFLRYVDQKRFDGTSFYRATKVKGAPGMGLIQGGVRGDPARMLPPIAHEPTTRTGLAHGDGTVSMARGAPGTARGDFFITLGPMSSFDARPEDAGDNLGFAAFGQVVDGMDVVHAILDRPTSPGEGTGAMQGQILAKPVRIVSARRIR